MQIDALDPGQWDVPGPAVAPPDESDGPVFVDESGRRSKKFRRLGWVLAIACACYAATLVVALIGGNSNAPWLLIPGPAANEKTNSTVEEPKVPADTPSGSAVPGSTPGALAPSGAPSAGAKGAPSGSPTAPGGKASTATSATPGKGTGSTGSGSAGASPNPKPSVSAGTGGSGGTGGQEPPPVTPDPTDSATAPTEEPSGPPAEQGGQQLAAEGDAP
ncbi:hypothetical protein [Streptomyces sp. NPDC059176]|uniref:hypothetical protein n=1 Tax=unclassified Streptomyces TaxID=2593676 RepID=UPI0036BBC14E